MRIRLGHSPDADDAFLYSGIGLGRVDTMGLDFDEIIEDIETLNRRAEAGEIEVSAISVHQYAYISDDYIFLRSGASMGEGYGPVIVTKRSPSSTASMDLSRARIGIPGRRTSAALALGIWAAEICGTARLETVAMPFDRIMDEVKEGRIDAGVIIHEGQLTYPEEGLSALADLGVWWGERTGGLPLPLGMIAARRDLGEEILGGISRIMRDSIEWAIGNKVEALAYAGRYGRGLSEEKIERFTAMYVNERTIDPGPDGEEAIARFLAEGAELGLVPRARGEYI